MFEEKNGSLLQHQISYNAPDLVNPVPASLPRNAMPDQKPRPKSTGYPSYPYYIESNYLTKPAALAFSSISSFFFFCASFSSSTFLCSSRFN